MKDIKERRYNIMKKFLQVVGVITCITAICSFVLIVVSILNCDEDDCDVDYIDDDFDFPELNTENE